MFNYIKIPNYFFEIKIRFSYTIIFLLLLSICSFFYKETLLYIFTKECFVKNHWLTPYFIYTNLTEVFYSYLELSTLIGFYLVFPYCLLQIWLFISPGLYKKEYDKIRFYLIIYLLIYVCVTLLTHFILLPFMWHFFSGFELIPLNNAIGIYFEVKLNDYIKFIYELYFVMGFYSQFCFLLISYILYSFYTDLNFIKISRSFIAFGIFLFASLITPPDVSSQFLIALPFLVCYEIILFSLITLSEYLLYSKKINNEKNGI